MAMLKRGAELASSTARSQTGSTSTTTAPTGAADSTRYVQASASDPEGYDYFQYYYLYPRTLASVNERLYLSYPHFPGYYPYGFGPFGPGFRGVGFHPFPSRPFRGPWGPW
jgi:hypothetical protein